MAIQRLRARPDALLHDMNSGHAAIEALLQEFVATSASLQWLAERLCELCEPYGEVRSCECVRLGGDAAVVLCFLEMHLPCPREALIADLGAVPFGEGFCVRLALDCAPGVLPGAGQPLHSNV